MVRRLFVLALVVAAAFACEDDPRYVYTARRYDATNGCLDPYSSIERVPGEGVSVRCREACLTVGDTVYVSPVCPPLPSNATALDDGDPACQAALDASRMEASCGASEERASPDTDGGEDAGDDAGQEVDAGVADAAEEG